MKRFYHLCASLMAVMALAISATPGAWAALPGEATANQSRSDEFENYYQYEEDLQRANVCTEYLYLLAEVVSDVHTNYADFMAGEIDEKATAIEYDLSVCMQELDYVFNQINEAYEAALESGVYECEATEQLMDIENVLCSLDIMVSELKLSCENAAYYYDMLTARMQQCAAEVQDLENIVLANADTWSADVYYELAMELIECEENINMIWSQLLNTPISMEVMEEIDAQLCNIEETLAALKDKIDGYTGISDAAVDANSPATYYDLNGRRVESPAAGSIVIKRQGTTATKTRF